MHIRLIFPAWERLEFQSRYVFPPLGVTLVAALTPPGHEVSISDENIAPVDAEAPADLVGISLLMVSQLPRALAWADRFRARGVPVVIGGISAGCALELAGRHADAVVVGEAEGVWEQVVRDAARGRLKPVYRRPSPARPEEIPLPRRDLLDMDRYAYRGVRMLELLETSRGCGERCSEWCLIPSVHGRRFRPRPARAIAEELGRMRGERLYLVDVSPQQSAAHERRLFPALRDAGKAWVGNPISDRPDILKLASRCGCWYVYQPVLGPSPALAQRIRRLREQGIGVEAAVVLGGDHQGPDIFQRLLDFLLQNEVDMAEFSILTPIPGSPLFERLRQEGRLLHEDWGRYNGAHAVFRPARMTAEQLGEGCRYLWRQYYRHETQPARMSRLFRRLQGRPGDPLTQLCAQAPGLIPAPVTGGEVPWGPVR